MNKITCVFCKKCKRFIEYETYEVTEYDTTPIIYSEKEKLCEDCKKGGKK
jgi:hypothetical protein